MVISRISGCGQFTTIATSSSSSYIAHPEFADIAKQLWEFVSWGRGGRRGKPQKAAFIRQGLEEGWLSNQFPFILDSSKLGRATFNKESVRREVEAQAASSSSRSVRPRLEAKTFSVSSTSSPDTLFLYLNNRNQKLEPVDHIDLQGCTRASKLLLIDWHQVFNRSRTGTAHDFGEAPRECVNIVVDTVRLAESLQKSIFVGILSYVDTDRRVTEVLQFLNATQCNFSFVLITRRDSGVAGKAGVIRDFIRQLDLDHSQVLFIDDKASYLEECRAIALQIQTLQVRVGRKPRAVGHQYVKFFEDAYEVIEAFLRAD